MVKQLSHATAHGYAVPLFDIFEMSGSEDCFAAAQEKRAPVIVGMYQSWFERPTSSVFFAALRVQAERSPVPVSIMLDHGAGHEQCVRAMDMGFTDVMFDGSTKPIDENIAVTRRLVELAHARGVGVEAELGHVGGGNEYQEYGAKRKGFTSADDVERFVKETGVDMLAIAIGTAHGAYQGEPQLDFALLAEIRKRVRIPLVLHGGSGLSEEQFRTSVKGGIAKINVATDLVQTACTGMRAAAAAEKASMFSIMKPLHEAIHDKCSYYLELFGAAGRA
jgi:fructose-bisphosphate aldolase, class II